MQFLFFKGVIAMYLRYLTLMRFVKPYLIIFGLILFSSVSFGQVRKYSNEFLNIGVGARALGMSRAQTAVVNDLTAGYWNPAGLLGVKSDFQVNFMHAEYFAGIAKYDYGSFAKPLGDDAAIGLSFIRFGIDDIPNTIDLIDATGNINYNRVSTFSATDYGFLASYAKKSKIEGLNLGANAKIVYRQVGDFAKAWGFGLDLGAQYKIKDWQLGAMFKDVTTTVNSWQYTLTDRVVEVFTLTGNDIPQNGLEITAPRLILGAGRYIPIKQKFGLMLALDLENTFDGKRNTVISSKAFNVDPYFGFEANYAQIIYLRGGVGNFQKVKAEIGNFTSTIFQPNFGVGLHLKSITIDYALTDIGDQSAALYSNIFSVKLDINKKVE